MLPGYDGRPPTVQIERKTPNLDYFFSYSQPIEAEPALLAMAQSASRATFDEVAPNYSSVNTSYRNEYYYGWSIEGTYGPLLSIIKTGGDGSRGQRGFEGSLLWDSERDRQIAWTELFDSGVWNGLIRREYCAGLQAERRSRGTGQSTSCPGFDQLGIALGQGSDGSAQLAFTALAYVAGSYAEGPYVVTIPVSDTMIASVQRPYRALFGASANASAAVALRDRLSEIDGVIAGEIGASDDFYFITGGAESFTRFSQFEALFQKAKPTLFMTIYEASNGNWGYSIKLDGKQHDLVPSDSNLDYSSRTSSVRRYSDGRVTVTIEKGTSITDNPAYGYSVDRITLTKGGEADTFRAINYGAA